MPSRIFLVALVILAVLLVLSAVLTETTWNVVTAPGLSGSSLAWNEDRTYLFSETMGDIMISRRVGVQVTRVSDNYLGANISVGDGRIAYGRGWVFCVCEDGFAALDVRNPEVPRLYGPVRFSQATGGWGFIPYSVQTFGTTTFAAGDRLLGGAADPVVIALNTTDPTALTNDTGSLTVRYTLHLDGRPTDIAVHDFVLYVAEENGNLRLYDLSVTPPPLLGAFAVGGRPWSLDAKGSVLGVVDYGPAPRLRLFDLVSGSLPLLGTVPLEGTPLRIALDGDRAYVSWDDMASASAGVSVVDIGDPSAPRVLRTAALDHGGYALVADRGAVFFLGMYGLHVLYDLQRSLILTNIGVQIAIVVGAFAVGVSPVLTYRRTRRAEGGPRDSSPPERA